MSSTNKGDGTYKSKKGILYEWKNDWPKNISWENLFTFPSRIERIMHTYGCSFSNSFSTCIGQQIQLCTSRSESRQHKFTDIGNSIFLGERSSTDAKFSEGFTPYSLLFLNCREQQGLKSSTSCKNSQDYSIYIFFAPWLEP